MYSYLFSTFFGGQAAEECSATKPGSMPWKYFM